MQKKILVLAGSYFQIPVIKYAKTHGHLVITCDNRPDNPGHKFADKYYNVSTTDLDGVLKVAEKEKIDGILAYGSDIAALAAAHVSENLNLPGNSFNSVLTLTDKGVFRRFLSEKGFPAPDFRVVKTLEAAKKYYDSINYNLFIKPVDSSGSKGISKLTPKSDLRTAFNYAMKYSRKKEVIIEKEIQGKGAHIHGEAFILNGELKFMLLGDQYFSKVNQCAPLSTTLPSLQHSEIMVEIRNMLERLISLVNFNTGGLNIEIIRDENDKIYFIEIGPRNGGNLMPELAMMATGFNMAGANVNAALNEQIDLSCNFPKNIFCTQVILHSPADGRFLEVNIPAKFLENLMDQLIYFKQGEKVSLYHGSQDVIGVNLYKFTDIDKCNELLGFIKHKDVIKLY